jgi:hypothetical protein
MISKNRLTLTRFTFDYSSINHDNTTKQHNTTKQMVDAALEESAKKPARFMNDSRVLLSIIHPSII